MRYQIIRVFECADGSGNFFRSCFVIVGQLYGYIDLSEAKADLIKLPYSDHCIIIQTWHS